ncbi:hypothetical protein [Bradyrhizobium sp. 21]|uniref:hypothetical protein n=1 Tax=Bradyrhizobium sp. 21 TaxID=2782666 RepID=UPI001FF80E0F|nr:hypothetical protein [Bradyrhizobium sp. 21]MCK1388725.1 hypothetical protein [Bradyrhizobium sp. 21]
MTSGRRRSRGNSDAAKGVLLAALGVAVLAALLGGFFYIKQTRPQLDAETNCPKTGPTAIHVLLFDRSDPITDQQAQRIRQTVEKLKEAAPFGMRFDIYTFQGDSTHVLQPKLRLCALGKPSEANQWIENPERMRQRYEGRFSSVLDQTVSELLRASKENSSPIVESLRAAAISSFGSIERGQVPLRLTMISDMIQHTTLYSQFQAEPNFQQLARMPAWSTLQPQLKGADVDILYLLRLSATRKGTPIQNRGHQLFWEQLISDSSGHLTGIETL